MIVSALTNPTQFPLKTIRSKSALVVAPHPDDETLGCGGAIALLKAQGCDLNVLVMSDGTLSHPRSQKFPASRLRTLRYEETRSAMNLLGVHSKNVSFLNFKDGAIPAAESEIYDVALTVFRAYLVTIAPEIIFVPWRFDPHPDHRATWQLVHTAKQQLNLPVRLIEYPIWDWDTEQRGEFFQPGKFSGWRLEIASVRKAKQNAIAQYRSQITDLIDDDPEGFRLTPEMLENFSRSWELYFEEES
ncbi:MAG TPA: PIG-L family deacetylase [Leptolyngbya sp.]|jgi:LmbE family N-acetylglucosaminyl deacetylase|nr:PIG-L family deacetylase [Leptolyngbya sp.]